METTRDEKIQKASSPKRKTSYASFLGRNLIQNWFSGIPGIPSKINQIINDKISFDEDDERNHAIEMNFHLSLDQIKKLIKKENVELYDEIETIDSEYFNASIGQVHKIVLKDKTTLAAKMKYPKIEETLQNQIHKLIKYSFVPPFLKYKFDKDDYQEYLLNTILEETCFKKEIASQQYFFDAFKGQSEIVIPKPWQKFSTHNLLIQSWEKGDDLETVSKSWEIKDKLHVAECIFKTTLEMIFKCNKIQSDFNFGNLSFLKPTPNQQSKVIFYDFGATLKVKKSHAAILWHIYKSVKNKEDISLFDHFIALGFDGNKLKYIADRLPAITRAMLEPFIENRPCQISNLSTGEAVNKILQNDKWWFRTAGPPWFFIFMKTIAGVLNVLKKLNVNLNFAKLIADSHIAEQVESYPCDIKANKHEQYHIEPSRLSQCASFLNFKVIEDNKDIVSLRYPYQTTDFLHDLIPEQYISSIHQMGYDFEKIVRDIQQSGYKKQVIFDKTIDHKVIKIYLD